MHSQLEESLQQDINHIRDKVVEMGELAERALRASLKALMGRNR